jgi:hypothetical protein
MIYRFCSLFFVHLDRAKGDNGTVLSFVCMFLVNAYTNKVIYDKMYLFTGTLKAGSIFFLHRKEEFI